MPIPYKPVSQKVLIEEAIAARQQADKENKKKQAIKESNERVQFQKSEEALRTVDKYTKRAANYTGFTETARNALLETAIFDLFNESMQKVDAKLNKAYSEGRESTMHALTFEFIHENGGAAPLLYKMKGHNGSTTIFLSELSSAINTAFKSILEGVDKNDPNTFGISNTISDEYRNQIHDAGMDEMSDCIADRVADAITEFINRNVQDKNAILNTLEATKEKIDSLHAKNDEELADLKEAYSRIGKRMITDIRERPRNLFSEMVTTMAESVMANKNLQKEYLIDGAHIDVNKIVGNVALMYGFLETLNTMNLIKVDKKYVNTLLESMKTK